MGFVFVRFFRYKRRAATVTIARICHSFSLVSIGFNDFTKIRFRISEHSSSKPHFFLMDFFMFLFYKSKKTVGAVFFSIKAEKNQGFVERSKKLRVFIQIEKWTSFLDESVDLKKKKCKKKIKSGFQTAERDEFT